MLYICNVKGRLLFTFLPQIPTVRATFYNSPTPTFGRKVQYYYLPKRKYSPMHKTILTMVALSNIFQGNIEQSYLFNNIIYTIYSLQYTPPFRVPYIPSSRKRLIRRLMELVPVPIRAPLGQFLSFH